MLFVLLEWMGRTDGWRMEDDKVVTGTERRPGGQAG